MANTATNVVYPNEVLENKYESVLTTALDLQRFVTVDNSLALEPGMTKRIVTRTVLGDAEDLAMGQGNTDYISVGLTSTTYTVGVTQANFPYYDEEAMTDPIVVEAGLKGMAEKMVNNFTEKAVAEWQKASSVTGTQLDFNGIVDNISDMNLENEDGLFLLVSPAMIGDFRRELKDDLKYVEAFVRSGYIGSVVGVPVYATKAIGENDDAVLAKKEAVTLFVKKGSEIEQERIPNTRQNKVYARKVGLVALTDATKVRKIAPISTTSSTTASGGEGGNG